MNYKIAVLGDRESVLGFRALGLEAVIAEDEETARKEFRRITKLEEGYAIVYVTEALYAALSEEIDKFKDSPLPTVILIPGKSGSLGLGQAALKQAVERAVGADIL